MLSVLFVVSTLAQAGEPVADAVPGLPLAIDRAADFLVKDALAWKEEHGCISCHHAALVIWAMEETRLGGRQVNEPFLAELTNWVNQEVGDGTTSVPRPPEVPRAFNEKALSFSLALGAIPRPDAATQEALRKLLATVEQDQLPDGSWASWPETRPPLFGHSDERATVQATLALLPAAAAGDSAAQTARDRAIEWLVQHPTDNDPQCVALRLVLWSRLGRPAADRQLLVERICQQQNSDGGWSQAAEMPSDAWATGQALYGLAQSGLDAGRAAIARGQGFLVATQRDDGSWPMTSRPTKPGGEGSTSLIPITGGGAAWGLLGLAVSH